MRPIIGLEYGNRGSNALIQFSQLQAHFEWIRFPLLPQLFLSSANSPEVHFSYGLFTCVRANTGMRAFSKADGINCFRCQARQQGRSIARAAKPLKIASLARYVNSIAEAHLRAQAPDPTVQGPAHDALRLARRVSDGEQQQRDPIQHHHLEAILALPCDAPREQQDVLLVAMAYETGQRVGAVAQIAVEDVTLTLGGGAEVKIFRHKTTNQNRPIKKRISPDLYRRLQAWLASAGIEVGPVFRPLTGRHNNVKNLPATAPSTNAVAAAMKRCMVRIGVEDLTLIGGHSTRIGGALDIAQNGGLQDLMRYGNWKTPAMPLRYTQRLTDEVNPIHQIFQGPTPVNSDKGE